MVTEALKTVQITSMDATKPRKKADARLSGDVVRVKKGTVLTILTASGVGSTYRMLRLPQAAMVRSVFVSSDDLGDTGLGDVGIYLPFEGAVVDADFFASAINLNTGTLVRSNIVHESKVYNLEDTEKPLWEALGETEGSSPAGYDVVITMTEITTAAGDLVVEVHYTL